MSRETYIRGALQAVQVRIKQKCTSTPVGSDNGGASRTRLSVSSVWPTVSERKSLARVKLPCLCGTRVASRITPAINVSSVAYMRERAVLPGCFFGHCSRLPLFVSEIAYQRGWATPSCLALFLRCVFSGASDGSGRLL